MAGVALRGGEDRRFTLSSRQLREHGVYVAIAVLVIGNVLFTENFATTDNLRTQLIQVAPIVVVAIGMALVIGTEGIDLSVGSVMALSAAVIPLWLGYGPIPAVAIALAYGAAVGLLNGSLVAIAGVQPIVATLALLVGGRGLALVISDGQLKEIRNPTLIGFGDNSLIGIPLTVLVAGAVALVAALVMRRTTFGRHLVAIGGNRTASFIAGLPVKRTLLIVYVVSGMLAALAGVMATARLTASDPSGIGQLVELSAITAVVVGGTPLAGGKVRILGTVAGALLIQLIDATLIKHDVPDSASQMVLAAIIVLAVAVQLRETKS